MTIYRCGPRKLAKSLVLCLDRLEASRNPNKPAPSFGQAFDRISDANDSDSLPKRENESGSKEKTSQLTIQTPGRRGSLPLKRPQVGSRDSVDGESGNAGAAKAARTGAGHTSPTSPRSLPERKSSNKNTTKAKISRNVLLVDDNHINLQLLVTYMTKSGHNFTTASNGREALDVYTRKCEQLNASGGLKEDSSAGATKGKDGAAAASQTGQKPRPFDFILMDLTMPVMDGLESTRHIRAYERSNNIKGATVIALTGLGSVNAQQEAYSSGINTFVTKPVRLKELSQLFDKEDDDYSKEGDKKGDGEAEKKSKDTEKDYAKEGTKKDKT